MRSIQILRTARDIAIKNPVFWLFGLALYGGFNLYLLNLFTLLDDATRQSWLIIFNSLLHQNPFWHIIFLLAGVILFLVLNLIKIFFIIFAHNEVHATQDLQCDLCVKVFNQTLPYGKWLKNVASASGITMCVTGGITLATGYIIAYYAKDNAPVMTLNFLLIALVICAVGIWNLFLSYFVVVHGMNFSQASQSALSLLILRLRQIVVFSLLLFGLYFLAVFIGNTFIYVWQNGVFGNTNFLMRVFALMVFILWFVINNVFFNFAFFVFFDQLVKSNNARKESKDRQLQPNILN